MIGVVPMAPSFNPPNSRTFASLALYTAPFLLSDMPFRKGQFYGVIKKVYLRLWNCRSRIQTNCSLYSLVTVEGPFARAIISLNQFKSLLRHRKLHGKLSLIRCQERFKHPTPATVRVHACA